jgi:two-component system chemotaxis response regulator CheV
MAEIQPRRQHGDQAEDVILEMLGTTVGMILHDIERIRRIKWDQIKVLPALLQAKHSGRITGVTKLEDSTDALLLIWTSIM